MYKLSREAMTGTALVLAATTVISLSGCDREISENMSCKVAEIKTEFQDVKNIVTSEDLMAYILDSSSLDEMKERINIVKSNELSDTVKYGIIESYFNKLVKKYFKEEDIHKFQLEGTIRESEESYIKLMINIHNIDDTKSLVEFLNELREYYEIAILHIDNETLANLDYEFDSLSQLIVESKDETTGFVDLSKIKNLQTLSLIDVNVKNIPNTITSISFGSKNHNEKYQVDGEIREFPNLSDLYYISFYNMNVSRISLPIMNSISLRFSNCEGETIVYNSDTNILGIKSTSENEASNFITIKGKVNEKIDITSDRPNVVLDNVVGNVEVVYSSVLEVATFGKK